MNLLTRGPKPFGIKLQNEVTQPPLFTAQHFAIWEVLGSNPIASCRSRQKKIGIKGFLIRVVFMPALF